MKQNFEGPKTNVEPPRARSDCAACVTRTTCGLRQQQRKHAGRRRDCGSRWRRRAREWGKAAAVARKGPWVAADAGAEVFTLRTRWLLQYPPWGNPQPEAGQRSLSPVRPSALGLQRRAAAPVERCFPLDSTTRCLREAGATAALEGQTTASRDNVPALMTDLL